MVFVHPRAGQMSGSEAAAAVRALPGYGNIRLGLVAGCSLFGCRAADFDCILREPFDRGGPTGGGLRRALTAAAGWSSEGALGLARSVGEQIRAQEGQSERPRQRRLARARVERLGSRYVRSEPRRD